MTDDQFEPREKLELAMLRAEHQKKFQMMIDFIKEQVGEGVEYLNPVARMVVSDSGAYYELIDLPEEFSGACGPGIEQTFVSRQEAIRLLELTAQTAEKCASNSDRQLQILALYKRRGLIDRKNCYVVNYIHGSTYRAGQNVTGALQRGVMPMFFKIKLDSNTCDFEHVIGMNHCILICLITPGDRYPLLRILLDSDHTTDLTARGRSRIVQ